MKQPDFSQMIESLRRGDASAADQFVERYVGAIRREVRFVLLDARLQRLVGESDVCQSVMASFFVGLWAGKYEFERSEEVVWLLKKMARNRVADLARFWTAQRRDVRRNVPDDNEIIAQRRGRGSTPSQIVANVELFEKITERLSDEERAILHWRQERVSWPDIAERLGQQGKAEAIRKRYDRALARVSEQLGFEL